MAEQHPLQTLYAGRYLSLLARGTWEFASRPLPKPAVGVLAITADDRIVLVEQYRASVDDLVVELPAGLAGDAKGTEDESLLAAAQRELLEETGYVAGRWTELGIGYSSPGLTNESIALYLAEDLSKVRPGGGDGNESIVIHEIAVNQLIQWLVQRGSKFDFKLIAGLYLAQDRRRRSEQ
jgi:ADP-ribose pyrophosphatase